MTRLTCTLGVFLFLFSLVLAAFPQNQSPLSGPDPDSSVLGVPLIAWSDMQTPEPVPQPLPEKPARLPDPQGEESPARQPAQTAQAQPQPQPPVSVTTLTGTIVKVADKYVLKTSGNATYALDNQEKAKQYEGKQVKVTGVLDVKSNTIQVESIELIS